MTQDLVIHKIFAQVVSEFPEKVALQIKKGSQWQRYTYKEIEASALKVGAFLIKEGLSKGKFAALILENRPEWAIIYLGITAAGLVCVPLDPQLTEQEIGNLLNDCGAEVVFVSRSVFEEKNIHRLRPALKKIVILDLDTENNGLLSFAKIAAAAPEDAAWPQVLPQDIASLIYTSGTTASPKGVLLSHYNLCSDFRSIEKIGLVQGSDNFLSLLPLYHTYAFMVTLLAPLFSGARVTYCDSFKPEDLARIIREAKVTILVGVPQLFSLIHKAIFDKIKNIPSLLKPFTLPFIKNKMQEHFGKSLRLLFSGGARLDPKIARDLSRLGFKLIEGYGLTETSPVVTFNPLDRIKFGSVGRPIPNVEIKIEQPDKSGIGEVLIKGPNVMQGYFKQPKLTAEAIKEGWFYSGDLGYIDKEGYLFLVGRKKDVIVLSSGKNIYPEELEEYYSASPYIKEICVLSSTEERFGRAREFLYAVIVADLEYFRLKSETNIREKIRWELENLSKNLPSYKHVMGFTITKEELPRTRLKKIKRYEVAQRYLKDKIAFQESKKLVFSEEELKTLDTDIARKVIDYLSQEFKRPVYLDSHLEIDLGIDSLSRVELVLGLEAILCIKIPDDLMYSVSTVKEIILNVQELINRTASGMGEAKKEEKTWKQLLQQPLSEAAQGKIRITAGFLGRILIVIFKGIFLFIFRVFWFLRIEGKEFIPSYGPYILCPNHASYLDGFFVFSSLPLKSAVNTYFLGLAVIFGHPLVNRLTKLAHLISIDPSAYLIEAMQAAAYVLRQKKVICIFPEGSRAINEDVGEFKKGIAILVQELNVPVIPVYIKGSHYSWPRGERFPKFYPVKIIFGRPFGSAELKKEGLSLGGRDDYEAIALGLRKEVLKLR